MIARRNAELVESTGLLLVLIILGGLIGWNLYSDRTKMESRERTRLADQTKVINDNLERQLAAVNNVLVSLQLEFPIPEGVKGGLAGLNTHLTIISSAMPGVRTLWVMNEAGMAIASNRPALLGQDLHERDYFKIACKTNDPALLHVSSPIKNALGTYAINLERSVTDRHGRFAGLVAATLDPEFFATLLNSVNYAPDMWATLVHADGTIFLLVPDQHIPLGYVLGKPGSLFTRHLESGQTTTVLTGRTITDSDWRMVARRTVCPVGLHMDNPLLVGVTRNLAALYAPWWQEVRIKGALFALLALTSVIGLANRFRQLRLLSRSAAIHAEQMQASATRYAKVMATVKDAIHIVDPQGRLIDWNPAFLAHLGYDAEEARGLRVEDWDALIPAGDIPERIMALSKSGGVFQTLHRRKDGKVLDVELSATGIMLDGRSLLLASARDMTERKQAELEREQMKTEVEQLQKLESLGRLAGGVAHDMNNVLGAILALSSAHLAILPKDNPLYPSLETMRDAATRGGDMVKRLLTFSRHTPKEKRELNLNDLLLEQARLLERTTLAKVHLDMDLAPDLHPTLGDGSALTHALMNLCVNAVDAMDDGGTLTFRTRNLGVDQIEVTVEDNGCGMTKEVLDRAMDPFFTTKGVGKGTGLGLSLVFTTVHAHGGQLKIQSEPGRGTQVTMTFPSTVSLSLEPGQEVPVRMVMAGHPLQVLLVDDDELIQKSTRMLVEVLGHSVTTCVSGEATIELLEQGFRPDAVILDMNMPGMGGKGTLPRLRRLFPTVPVLLATGRADQEAMDLVAAHPFVTLLSKPFSFEELRGHLHQVAGGRPTVQNS